ncbi:D-3-phosphoglycerate dehydrogenase-like protein [Trypanosoma grayi]|uniref:D-3-phosphoglycerate dehydrogenase-like protein n=1 Tax=Trypanosoma grayi TaxID=71804 RepID=UPI0004F41B66|nr:D-3-phosphoglycerate dehydrogenase-like protein [Trypanosoma grayi]KEG13738.1 D-3-phosphoglycerate dehydrogenase-like protein [Trypanosoma grayi]
MRVMLYDAVPELALANTQRLNCVGGILVVSDFVTVHVTETPLTKGIYNAEKLKMRKKGACFLNLIRDTIGGLDALGGCLLEGHLEWAVVVVHPVELEGAE